jgi:phosphatidylglycerophosphate synthase
MRRYRLADALHLPSYLSASRVPLGVAFVLVVGRPLLALALLATAALTDVLDGWIARRMRLQNATGALIDGVADKIFVACVAFALIASGRLGWLGLLALATRELGELGLLSWYLVSHARRRKGAPLPAADVYGKGTTCLQFAAVVLALLAPAALPPVLVATAVLGTVAAAHYVRREVARLSPTPARR